MSDVIKICDKEIESCGYDTDGYLVSTNGDRFKVVPLEMEMATFQSLRLIALSRLAFIPDHTGGQWQIDGKPVEFWPDSVPVTHAGLTTGKGQSDLFTRWALRDAIRKKEVSCQADDSLARFRQQVVGVAWMQERYWNFPGQIGERRTRSNKGEGAHGDRPRMITAGIRASKSFEAVFLSEFRPVLSSAAPEAQSSKSKTVPRWENGFSLAVVEGSQGKEKTIVITQELQEIIRRIADDGNGTMARSRLLKDKKHQPEKLFKTEQAKKLIKAGLLGMDKDDQGRTIYTVRPPKSG